MIKIEFADAAEERDAVALAAARQEIAHEGVLSPTWDELDETEQHGAVVDALHYLRAARRALVFPSVADAVLAAEADQDTADRLARLDQELRRSYADLDRVETQNGMNYLALRLALGILSGEQYSMSQLIRRVRQVVAERDEVCRKAASASGRARHLVGQVNPLQQRDDAPVLQQDAPVGDLHV